MSTKRSVGILSTGSYTPERVLTNFDLEKMVETSDEWIVSRTGIRERRISSPEQASSDLAYEAAKEALEKANISAEQLDMIIVATVTPDMSFPSTACCKKSWVLRVRLPWIFPQLAQAFCTELRQRLSSSKTVCTKKCWS